MGAILDIIVSFTVGGLILLIILAANDIAAENHAVYNGDMLVQEMLVSTAQVVEGELRNMGFGVAETVATILEADSNSISFLVDLGRDGAPIDTIRYYVGPTSELSATQNEADRLLHRRVNSQPSMQIGAVTLFDVNYITQGGDILSRPVPSGSLSEIHTIEVTMEVQNPYAPLKKEGVGGDDAPEALFSTSLWQQTRLASQNSRR
jgi:hypothetical protein